VDRPVKLWLRSKDVLHNFTVAQFRVKMDLVPGMVTYMWLTPTETGRFEVLCEELCGIAHHTMRGAVMVEEQAAFDAWAGSQPTFADMQQAPPVSVAAGAAQYAVCAACHGPQGEGMQALNAPKIAGQEPWYLKRQLRNYKGGLRGAHEEDVFGKQMAPMARTLATDAAIDNIVAHIATLPDRPPAQTIDGNVKAGASRYVICAYCHGAEGQGIEAMNAPRLAGMTDWYLAHQLNNFKQGIRGEHPEDYYGKQMGYMGRILQNDQAVNDVIAYINTLQPSAAESVASAPRRSVTDKSSQY
jgi:cytochrome c oxidase subunit 2